MTDRKLKTEALAPAGEPAVEDERWRRSPTGAQTLYANRLVMDGDLSLAQAAAALGISKQALHQRFVAAGLPTRRPDTRRETEAREARAAEVLQAAYRELDERRLTVAEYRRLRSEAHPDWPSPGVIVRAAGEGSWSRALEAAGIPSRQDVARKRRSRILELWDEGLSMREIAERVGSTTGTVSTELSQMRASGVEVPRRQAQPVADKRERILDAFAREVAQHGYAAVALTTVMARAGVSSQAFYSLFADKAACFVAAYDAAVENLLQHVRAVYEQMPQDTPERARAALAAVLDVFADTPERARMCLIEVAAAGPEAVQRQVNTVNGFMSLLEPIKHYRSPVRQPDPITRKALVGGITWVIYDRVVEGQTEQLPGLLPQMTHFLLTPFLGEPRAAAVAFAGQPADECHSAPEVAPQAIGDQVEALLTSAQLRSRRGNRGGEWLAANRARILQAFAQEVFEKGYSRVEVADVYRRAGLSSRPFYDLFKDKADCFNAAFEQAAMTLLENVRAVYERMPTPAPERARAVVEAVLTTFAQDPQLARMCTVEVAAANPRLLKRYVRLVGALGELLGAIESYPGFTRRSRPLDPVESKALIGGIYWVIYDWIVSGQTERLPELVPQLTQFLLEPFIGEHEAAKVAHGTGTSAPQARSAGARRLRPVKPAAVS